MELLQIFISSITLFFHLSFSWNMYKINQQQDKIGVFVSIVSTKIPFKGTGKEYIGDDITEIADAVKVHRHFPYLLFLYGHLHLLF
jgi:hypothetical protein